MNDERLCVLTIGHSTHSLEAFVALLKKHQVTALADVRSQPSSRFNPQFNKLTLESALRKEVIKYVFLGLELGARPGDPSCYENGRIRYERLASTKLFAQGIDRVMRGAREHRIALMCAEKEPLECHRALLIAQALDKRDIEVAHILGDGSLEAHHDTLDRLLDIVGSSPDLFSSRKELIVKALARQEEKVAYPEAKLISKASVTPR